MGAGPGRRHAHGTNDEMAFQPIGVLDTLSVPPDAERPASAALAGKASPGFGPAGGHHNQSLANWDCFDLAGAAREVWGPKITMWI